jgi:hypothetical protein
MTTPTEDDTSGSSEDASAENAFAEDAFAEDAFDRSASDRGTSSERAPGPSGPRGTKNPAGQNRPARAERSVAPEEWRRLRAPFSRDAYVVESRATGRSAANLPLEAYSEEGDKNDDTNKSVVDLRLRPEAIRDRLDLAVGPGRYAYRFESGIEAGGTFSMLCYLRVGPATRTGVGTGSSPQTAGHVALASAASAFGMGTSGKIAGPIVAKRESRYELPTPVLEALERQEEPSPWTPEGWTQEG